jgi:hypothetical protein
MNKNTTSPITAETLAPHAAELFAGIRAALPTEIAGRLKPSPRPRPHGNHSGSLLFNIWDKHQNAILQREHFCYCLGYAPNPGLHKSSTWYLHLWINTKRLEGKCPEIVAELRDRIRRLPVPDGFELEIKENHISVQRDLPLIDPPRLAETVAPLWTRLIAAYHHALLPVIDRTAGRPDAEKSRAIPPALKKAILSDQGNLCALCGSDLSETSAHIDHIHPFSKGGKTERANLQALCPRCNTTKGNRTQ